MSVNVLVDALLDSIKLNYFSFIEEQSLQYIK